ncbi:MAG: LPP20 family lipoprotein [Spirochaetaceae bacterium]|jgi:hypothetical protein|nr:LPP20 family lipoprotein [Spirochaetaceae bacterium]
MLKIKKIMLAFLVLFLCTFCVTAQNVPGKTQAEDAQQRMDKAFSAGQNPTEERKSAGGQSSPTQNPAQNSAPDPAGGQSPSTQNTKNTAAVSASVPDPLVTRDKNGKPNWVDKPDSAYDKRYYLSAIGYGTNRQQAEASAFSNLTGLFGQSVTSKISTVESYKEKIVDGAISVESGDEISNAVELSSSIDQLIGAEINDRWEDKSRGLYYAAAIMEKPRAINIYTGLIDSNRALIEKLTNIPAAEKNTIDGIVRYHFAASLADTNDVFATVLSILGGPDKKNELKSGEDYRYEAGAIAKKIPVNVVVKNDVDGRIKAAFVRVFTDAGFRTGNSNSRYVLNAVLSISAVELNNQNKFSRYVVDASLIDSSDNSVLTPFNINGREGHLTQPEANARAVRAAEQKIKEDFSEALREYLSSALPKK